MATVRVALIALLSALVLGVAGAPATSSAQAQGVAAWGINDGWQLGAGYRSGFSLAPVASLVPGGVEEVHPGDGTSVILAGGQVYTTGNDVKGQCGCGIRTSAITHWSPVHFPAGTVIAHVSVNAAHLIAVSTTGIVYVWGGNLNGELANGITFHGKEGPGDFSDVVLRVALPRPAVQVVAGGASNFAILDDGTVEDWGENKTGQLGDGTFIERLHPVEAKVSGIAQLSAGGVVNNGAHVVAVTRGGATLAWGADGQGQLGDGTTKTSPLPVQVKLASTPSSVTSAVSHSLAVMPDGTVKAWGSNEHGELGTPTTQKCARTLVACSSTPVSVTGLSSVTQASAGFGFSLATAGGRAYGFGWGEYGKTGNGTTVDQPLPAAIGGLYGVLSVHAGQHYGMALLAGEPPPPVIALTPGHLSLAVAWSLPTAGERWAVNWRPITKPASSFGKYVYLPSTTRSYTVNCAVPTPVGPCLGPLTAGQTYEVLIRNNVAGGRRVQGVPLP